MSSISGSLTQMNIGVPPNYTRYIDVGTTVTSIDDYALHNFSSLETINIPDNVTSIGANSSQLYCINNIKYG